MVIHLSHRRSRQKNPNHLWNIRSSMGDIRRRKGKRKGGNRRGR